MPDGRSTAEAAMASPMRRNIQLKRAYGGQRKVCYFLYANLDRS
jgi:hypothetical protein